MKTMRTSWCAGIALYVIGVVSFVHAQAVERTLPESWQHLVPGGAFIDRFEPSLAKGPLTRDCWGADGVKPRDVLNGIEDAKYSYWGGNIRRDEKGKYHLFVARWLESQAKGHMYWHWSDVCHAVADCKEGPFKPLGDLGRGHNPEVFRCKDGSWCVYVINGCYRAPTLDGPWKYGKLVLLGLDGKPTRDVTNYSFAERPDGSVLAVCRHGNIWLSPDGLAPFVRQTERSVYPAINITTFEDPVLWRDEVQYNLIVNDWMGRVAWYLTSPDGIGWRVMPGKAYGIDFAAVRTPDGTVTTNHWFKYERIHIYQDEYGRAVQANFAVIDVLKRSDLGNDTHSSKNITVPLNPGRRASVVRQTASGWTIRIKSEPGFDARKDVDVKSLTFGDPVEVAFGRGVKALGSTPVGNDLDVTFPPSVLVGPIGKILGRETGGRLLFCDLRVSH